MDKRIIKLSQDISRHNTTYSVDDSNALTNFADKDVKLSVQIKFSLILTQILYSYPAQLDYYQYELPHFE